MIIEIILIALTVYFLWSATRKPSNYPPGPWGLPLFGSIPLGMDKFEEQLKELHKQHGNLVSWRIGTRFMVFIFDFKLIKEALMSTQFVDRPDTKLLSVMQGEKNLGVVATSGIHWQSIRRFSLRHLRDLGMGKSKLTLAVQHEANELIKDFKTLAGRPAHLPHSLTIAVLNVIWQMIASKRYSLHDKEIEQFEDTIQEMNKNTAGFMIIDIFPWMEQILPEFLYNKITSKDLIEKFSTRLREFFVGLIDHHIKTLNEDDPRDYIDAYLIEMKKHESDPDSTMSMEDLIYCLSDLYFAGSETTKTTLHWAMYYLASFPNIQKRLQKEIDEVLPKGTLATLEDKSKLPYTDAFIHEVLRFSTITPNGVMHSSSTDIKYGGYTIPKGSLVFPVIESVHFNPQYFDSPKEFRPERFLDLEGKFVNPKDGFMPFSIGRRQCVGESLARMELLIFLTALVQSFNFSTPPGKTICLKPIANLLFHPPIDQELLITIR